MTFEVRVEVMLRPGIADPQGATVERALPALGFDGVTDVRMGKVIHFTVEAPDIATARARAQAMCERLLANPVIEDAAVEVVPARPRAAPVGVGADSGVRR